MFVTSYEMVGGGAYSVRHMFAPNFNSWIYSKLLRGNLSLFALISFMLLSLPRILTSLSLIRNPDKTMEQASTGKVFFFC